MNYNITYQLEKIDIKQLMTYYKPKQVFEYCSSCPNHGRIWSCPPHHINIEKYLSPYKQAWIIGAKVHINQKELESQNLQAKEIEKQGKIIFSAARREFGNKLFELEKQNKKSTILLAGNCYQCKECTKKQGKPCPYPDKLRYSLESIGFLVSDIVKEVLNDEIQWIQEGKLPTYLLSIGAILLETPVQKLKQEVLS